MIFYKPNGRISLETNIDAAHDTVWLTQQQISDLFGTTTTVTLEDWGADNTYDID